jgi:GNAT superfamily N-acetyltransferase
MTITWDELAHFWDPNQPRDGRGRWTDMGRATAAYKGRHDKARRILEKATTRSEAEEAIKASFGVDPEDAMPSVGNLRLYDLSDQQGIKLANHLVKLNEKYPGAVISSINAEPLGTNLGGQVLTPKVLSGPSQIRLDINSQTFTEDFGKENPGFLNGSGTEYTVTHEYGHIIHMNVVGDYSLKQRPGDRGNRRLREADKWVTEYERSIGRQLSIDDMSEYSWVGGNVELVAESFADVEVNGDTARPLSKYMHHRLTTAYRDRVMNQQALFAEDVSRETELIELFYSPSQPRDAEGKWTDGAGGGRKSSKPKPTGSTVEKTSGGFKKVPGKPGWVIDANGREVHGFGEDGLPLAEVLERTKGNDHWNTGSAEPAVADTDSIAEEVTHAFSERTGTLAGGEINAYGELEMEGVVEVPDGDDVKEIGTYKRRFEPDGEGGLRVNHEFFSLYNKHQGQGIGSQFLKDSEDYYRDLGVTEITVEANIDVGGFAWARLGFDFQSGDTAVNFVNELYKWDDGTPEFSSGLDGLLTKATKYEASGDPSDAPSAFEISQIGHTPGAKKWPGKQFMLGQNWEGIKYLDYPQKTTTLAEEIEAITAFYDPNQPRDGEGKWTSTGGGAKAKVKAKQARRKHTGPGAVSAMIKAGELPTKAQVKELMERYASRVDGTKVRVETGESGIPGEDGYVQTVTAHLDYEGDKMHVTFQKYRLWGKDNVTVEMHVDDIRPEGATLAPTMAMGLHYHLSGDGLGEKAPKHEHTMDEVNEIQNKRNARAIAKYEKADRAARAEAAVRQEAERNERREKIKAYKDANGPVTELPPGKLQELMELGDTPLVGEAAKVLDLKLEELAEGLPMPKGVSVAEVGVTDYSRDRIDYGMQFINDSGFAVGYARRRILLDPDTNELMVYNDHFELNEDHQGQGFGSAFTKASDDFHRSLGIHRVEVQANIDVGGYAWARLGFGWNPTMGAMHGSELTSKAIGLAIRDSLPEAATFATKLGKFYESKNVVDLPTPFEISRLGWKEGATEWPGKNLLLGANWQGMKRLDVSRETSMAEVMTMFYDPGQPRDARGRWSSTGGGGKLNGSLTKVFRKHMGGKNLRELLHSRTLEEHGDMLGDVDTSKLFVATAKPLAESGMGLKLRETSPGIVQARLMDAAEDRGDVLMTAGPSVTMYGGQEMRVNIAPSQHTKMEDIDRLERTAVDVAKEMGYEKKHLAMGSFESARENLRQIERQKIEQKAFEKRRDAHKADLQKLAAAGDRQASFAYILLDGQEAPIKAAGQIIAEDLSSRLEGTGLKLEKQFTETGVNHLRNHYEIQDERGTRIGAATRTYYHDVDSKETRVVHDLLQMSTGVQGQGYGTKFLKASEEHYRETGVRQAELYANIDVGGYAWARNGFQWASDADMATVMNNFESNPDLMGPKAKADYEAIKVRAQKAYDNKIPSMRPTPFEFSEIGRGEILPDYDMHAGKAYMLGTHWNGIKRYDPPIKLTGKFSGWDDITAFYDPSQPRDANGRWSSTGGGGGGGGRRTALIKAMDEGNGKLNQGKYTAESKAVMKALGEDINARLKGTGLTIENMYSSAGDRLYMEIFKDGQKVGSAQRDFAYYPGEDKVVVTHVLMAVNKDRQGQGIGSAFIKASEEAYRAAGVDRMQLKANIDVGGYAWARAGFNFYNDYDARAVLRKVYQDTKVDPSPKLKSDYEAAWAKMERFDKSGNLADLPTPLEVSQIGREPGMTSWPGKAHMLASEWEGYKDLNVSRETSLSEADVVELFYDPSQPRDERGRWTSGGGAPGGGRAEGYKVRPGERELDAMTKHMRPQLTDAEMDAIEYLKIDAGADAVNYYQREVVGTELEQKYANEKSMVKAKAASEALDTVFADLPPIQEELTLYRGFRDSGEGYLPQNLAGQELVDDGYMFVTADRDVAKYYAEQTDGKTLIMQMKAPPGTKVLPFWALHESHIDDVSGEYTSNEAYSEMLLPRGTKVTVDNVFSMGGGVIANARIT